MSRGFSLVELLISLLVTAVLLISLLQLFNEFNITNFRFLSNTEHIYEMSRAFDFIERDLDHFVHLNGKVEDRKLSFIRQYENRQGRVTYYVANSEKLMRKANGGYNTIAKFKEDVAFIQENDILTITIDSYSLSFRLSGSGNHGIQGNKENN